VERKRLFYKVLKRKEQIYKVILKILLFTQQLENTLCPVGLKLKEKTKISEIKRLRTAKGRILIQGREMHQRIVSQQNWMSVEQKKWLLNLKELLLLHLN